jgi:CRP/FNR family transcriptional regulator
LFIEAVEESDICRMDRERFESYLLRHPQFMMNMIQAISERLSHMSRLAQHLALGKLHDKILHVLMQLSSRFGLGEEEDGFSVIRRPISHQELAHLVGVSREAVSVTLKELAEAGIIRTGFRTVAIRRDKIGSKQH